MTDAAGAHGTSSLPRPLRYLPALSGRYEVRPGLARLDAGRDVGGLDQCAFQLDDQFARYRAAKLAARAEALSKYVCPTALRNRSAAQVVRYLIERLSTEYPDRFELSTTADGGYTLSCRLSLERLCLGPDFSLLEARSAQPVNPPYACAWDALACQVQEDLCLVELTPEGGDRVHALHVCLPNHWSPAEKLGQDFAAVHGPVPNMERINSKATRLLALPRDGGATFVRFAWGLATDDRLNHHPEAPADMVGSEWPGRRFDPAHPRLLVRTERQTLSAVPNTALVLFTIRTYLDDVQGYTPEQRLALAEAVESMSEEAARYKGLGDDRQAIVSWLRRA
jgi:hypothetical protein